jgi:predicted AlkP superfamily phosphohydrolase/phosphomutase
MPVLAGLFERGRWGMVANPKGFESGSCWPSFATGVGPDFHGQYDGWFKFDAQTYQRRQLTRREIPFPPIWKLLSDGGKQVCIIDFPYAFLEDNLNGVQVADWFTHVRTMPRWLMTTPPGLAAEIAADFGTNPFDHEDPCPTNYFGVATRERAAAFRDHLLSRVERKAAYSERLLRQSNWDLFITVFHDAHDAGHICWHVHDPSHELHDAAIAAAVGDPLRDVYAALDQAVGRLLDAAGDAVVFVYASHGMAAERTASNFLSDILESIEEAYRGLPPPTRLDRIRTAYRALVPSRLREIIRGTDAAKRMYTSVQLSDERLRLRSARFFELTPNQATGGVRFNVAGRERNGVVAPGAEYEHLRDRLAGDLLAIRNLETGNPLVDEVIATDRLYPGPMRHVLPDLLLEWNKTGPIRSVGSPLIGILENQRLRPRTGDHQHKEGFFIAIARGGAPGRTLGRIDVTAFAPAIAHIVGTKSFPGSHPLIAAAGAA